MATRKAYVVQQIIWSSDDEGFVDERECRYVRGYARPFRAYFDRMKADALCVKFDKDERVRKVGNRIERINPFMYVDAEGRFSTLSEEQLFRHLEEIGLRAPPKDEEGDRSWETWWEEVQPHLTDEQVSRIWELTDRVRFYEIEEVALESARRIDWPARCTCYAVSWRSFPYEEHLDWLGKDQRPPRQLLKLFSDADRAKEFLRALSCGERASPPTTNPFFSFRRYSQYPQYGFTGLAGLTSFDEPIFEDWVRDLGLEPPELEHLEPAVNEPDTFRDWFRWWEQHAPHMTDLQRSKIWQVLDKLEFYEIVETSLWL